jgi:hypothetical protein
MFTNATSSNSLNYSISNKIKQVSEAVQQYNKFKREIDLINSNISKYPNLLIINDLFFICKYLSL